MAEEFEFLEDYPQLYKDMLNLTDFRIFKDKLNMVGGNIDNSTSYGFETAFWMGAAGQKQDGTMIMIILSMSYATLRVLKHFI